MTMRMTEVEENTKRMKISESLGAVEREREREHILMK